MNIFFLFIYTVSFLFISFIGILLLVKDIRSPIHRYFGFFSIATSIWVLLMYFNFTMNTDNRLLLDVVSKLTFSIAIVALTLLCLFFYYFPYKTIVIKKIIQNIFLVFSGVLLCITTFTSLVSESQIIVDNIYQGDVLGPLHPLYSIFLLCCVIIIIVFAIHKIIHIIPGIDREKIKISTIGFIIFLGIAVNTNVVFPMLGIDSFLLQKISPIWTLFFIIPTYYSIQKYRTFHLSYSAFKILRRVIISVILTTIIFFTAELITYLTPNLYRLIRIFIIVVVGIITYDQLKKLLPTFIPENLRTFTNSIKEFHAKMYYCKTYNELQKLLEQIFLIKLNILHSKFFIIRKRKTEIKENFSIYVQDGFTNSFKQKNLNILVTQELQNKNDKKFLPSLQKLEAEICMPLYSESKLIGLFVLGAKGDKSLYYKEEIKEILKIKKDLEINFMNILLSNNLQTENNIMKQIVKQKTKNLFEQNEEITKLLRQQKDFIAVTAHEFRTPLSIAIFQLEDTIESYKHKGEVLKEMKIVESSLYTLKNLTQKLFDTEQFDLNKVVLNLERISLTNYLQKIYKEFIPIMKEKNIQFKKDISNQDIFVKIDESYFRQVLMNILNNAYKFTSEDGIIKLSCFLDGENIKISIQDNGKGIKDENKERIFEKFQITDVQMGMGIGLGLFICKKIIELHKGNILVKNATIGGSDFIISLPL